MRCDWHDDLLLILINPVLVVNPTAAARARIRHRDGDRLIDTIGNRPMPMTAVLLAPAPPTPARIRLGVALGERRGLALARPPRLLKLRAQPRVLGHQTRVLRPQPQTVTLALNPETSAPTTSPTPLTHSTTIHSRKIPCTPEESCHRPRRHHQLRSEINDRCRRSAERAARGPRRGSTTRRAGCARAARAWWSRCAGAS